MKTENEIAKYFENISLVLFGILFLAFPLLFTTSTTEPFVLPKQILLGSVAVLTLLLLGAKMIALGKVQLRRTPFDFPLFLFGVVIFLSSCFSLNRFDSLIAFVPVLFTIIAYFVIINTVKNESSVLFLLLSFVIGASLSSVLSILSFFKQYILPFPATHAQNFTTLGSLMDQAVYYGAVLVLVGLYFVFRLSRIKEQKIQKEEIGFTLLFILILGGFIATMYQLITLPPSTSGFFILPLETGFQTAFAAISQDAKRLVAGFLLGSGFGTYTIDFTQYKLPTFNLYSNLWSFTFFRSTSFVLELLATTGVLGVSAYLFLLAKIVKVDAIREKIKDNVVFLPLVLLGIVSFLLPFSFIEIALFFLLLSLFSVVAGLNLDHQKENHYFDIELHFLAAKNSIIPFSSSPVSSAYASHSITMKEERSLTKFLPVGFFVLTLLFTIAVGFFSVRYIASDVLFQNSLVAATNNNAMQIYNNQVQAVSMFPYRDMYFRVYSQTNLALANSLASQKDNASPQSNVASPSAQTQQTIYTLIQQSITSARQAAAISPKTALNWQNLATIYRNLIGFGENAENFSLVSQQQAVLLDPNNPQAYIALGGIYYQLGQWENAQRQFQTAINLKPDFANAYYNLAHTLENKGDLKNALAQYQTVLTLVADSKEGVSKIDSEIAQLQEKIGKTDMENARLTNTAEKQVAGESTTKLQDQPPLRISSPSAQLPLQQNPVQIEAPSVQATPSAQ